MLVLRVSPEVLARSRLDSRLQLKHNIFSSPLPFAFAFAINVVAVANLKMKKVRRTLTVQL